MSFPKYPKYKDSGVIELGDLPEHWDVKPLKHFAGVDSCGCYGVDAEEGEHLLPVATTAQIDSDGRFVVPDMPMRGFTLAEIQRYGCGDGDVLVVKSSGSATNIISGKAGLVTKDTPLFVFSNFLMRIRPTSDVADSRFVYALLRSHLTRQRVEQMCSTTTYPNLKVSEYTSAPLPLPPLAEQTAIASFLDAETSKIDALIAEQRRLIELLKEKRQAVISHAVTKGLNPDAPMKASGIEWLGDVPEHWEVTKVGYVASVARGTGYQNVQEVDQETDSVQMIRISDFNDFDPIWVSYFATLDTFKVASTDLLMAGTGASAGITMRVTEAMAGMIHSYNAPRIRCLNVLPEFLHFVLNSQSIHHQEDLLFTGSAQHFLDINSISKLEFAYCSLSEQKQIIDDLNDKLGELDSLTAEATRAIDLLQERRTALISAAVTGKIDVREFASVEAA